MAARRHGAAGACVELARGLLLGPGLVAGVPVVLDGLLQLSVEVVEEVVEGGGHGKVELLSGGPEVGNAIHGHGRRSGCRDIAGAEGFA